jgi:hypothetical protein
MELLDLPNEILIHIIRQIPVESRYPLKKVNHFFKGVFEEMPYIYHDIFKRLIVCTSVIFLPKRGLVGQIALNPKFRPVEVIYPTGLFMINSNRVPSMQSIGYQLNLDDVDDLTPSEMKQMAFQIKRQRFQNLGDLLESLHWIGYEKLI